MLPLRTQRGSTRSRCRYPRPPGASDARHPLDGFAWGPRRHRSREFPRIARGAAQPQQLPGFFSSSIYFADFIFGYFANSAFTEAVLQADAPGPEAVAHHKRVSVGFGTIFLFINLYTALRALLERSSQGRVLRSARR